jgi:hypothetical protein
MEREKEEKKNRLQEILNLERRRRRRRRGRRRWKKRTWKKSKETQSVEGEPPFPILPRIEVVVR